LYHIALTTSNNGQLITQSCICRSLGITCKRAQSRNDNPRYAIIPREYPYRKQWSFIEEWHDPDAFFTRVLETFLNGEGLALRHGEYHHAIDAQGELMCSFLVKQQTILTVVPYSTTGYSWPLVVDEVHPGPNGYEGKVLVHIGRTRVGLHDCLFFRNAAHYGGRRPVSFVLNALAYELEETPEAESPSFEQAGGIDEIRFTSPVHGVRAVSFWDIPVTAYTISLGKPGMRILLFTPRTREERAFKPGEWVQGQAWLFGQMPPSEAEPETAEE